MFRSNILSNKWLGATNIRSFRSFSNITQYSSTKHNKLRRNVTWRNVTWRNVTWRKAIRRDSKQNSKAQILARLSAAKTPVKRMQHRSTLLNSTLLDGVGLRGHSNATCCAEQIRIVEIKDLGRIMIPNFRPNVPLPLPVRWFAARAWVQQC